MSRLFDGRWVGLLGIGWFVLFLIGAAVLQGEPPAAGTPVTEVRAFFHDHGVRYLAGDYVAGCAFLLLLLPFGVLAPRVLTRAPHPPAATLAAAAAAALVVAGGTATSFLDAVALSRGDARLDDSTVAALLYANSAGIALIGLPAAVFAAATATLVRNVFVMALGWTAAVLLTTGAAFPLVSALWTVRFVSFLTFAVFVLATSALILSVARPPGHHAPGGDA
ncbi:hypothetical protein [Dactylosporangium sp. NPDC005555]|uniref:hypothetical protein n=1 Tax=Dactylosporangium sp. NPDC005555 TaxID=3154889 RepID=UPI0033B74878